MANFVKDQTAGRLIVDTNIDFSVYTSSTPLIKYTKPDGTTGSWDATVLSGSEADGKIYVDFTDDINFDAGGFWVLWPHVTLSDDSTVAAADSLSYYVAEEGERV